MINYVKGDLFAHTTKKIAVLAHACNPHGLWGGGIAAQFRKRYPKAYQEYALHCREHGNSLLGSSFLATTEDQQVLVACLFTSDFSIEPSEIVKFTGQSMTDLTSQLKKHNDIETDGDGKPVISMPMINSGIFGVPWEDTEAELQKSTDVHIDVYTL